LRQRSRSRAPVAPGKIPGSAARSLPGRDRGIHGLTGIRSLTLVIQGDNDLMIATKLSHLLVGLIPDARIRIYPDSAHAFLFQYPEQVAADVNAVLG
jgi:pimeloyl-ACP methyl ester carboxylesterase